MRFFLTCFLFIALSADGATIKSLFIGNSYTYVNTLPNAVSTIATSKGHTLIFDSSAPGGYTFNAHTTNATTIQKIEADAWDFVILQEQSQIPSFPISQVEQDCYPYAAQLCEMIRSANPCARPLFYMTWGRENGDSQNCASWPPVCTYQGMQDLLTERYIQMAVDNDAWVAPVGMIWSNFVGDLPLYAADGSHPSIHGTYLAACTFFAVMFNESPIGASFPAEITSEDALAIQESVNAIVFGNQEMWNLDLPLVWTSIEASDENIIVDASGTSESISIAINGQSTDYDEWPVVISTESFEDGEYTFIATSSSTCGTATETEVIVIDNSNAVNGINSNPFVVYPNPTSNSIQIHQNGIFGSFEIVGSNGQLIRSGKLMGYQQSLDMSQLQDGIYILRVSSEHETLTEKIVINSGWQH